MNLNSARIKWLLLTITFGLVSGIASIAFGSDTETMNVEGEVVAPVTLSNVTALSGWKFVGPSTGSCTYKISTDGNNDTSIESDNASGQCSILSSASGGSFDISGDSNQQATLSYTSGGFQSSGITLKEFKDGQGGSLNSDRTLSPDESVNVGGKIKVENGASTGNHSTSVSITVSYQ